MSVCILRSIFKKNIFFLLGWLFFASGIGQANSELPMENLANHTSLISPGQAIVLGLVEGITEYLPISSTGHLVVADEFLGLRNRALMSAEQFEAIEAYEIVVQAGAILAVILLYGSYIKLMVLGLFGRSTVGLRLLMNVAAGFIPTAIFGLLLHSFIKSHLQSLWPVVTALAFGGVLMILFERTALARRRRMTGEHLETLTIKQAMLIGLCQCLALWPGTSRSMTTIIGGMVVGLSPVAAAEFSFILGLPTLLAATGLKLVKDGHLLIAHVGITSMFIGLAVAALSAALAVRGFVMYLNKRGLAPFGWYRIALAAVIALLFSAGAFI